MSTYIPRAGTVADRICRALVAEPECWFTTTELAKAASCTSTALLNSVDEAIREALISRERRDTGYFWKAGPNYRRLGLEETVPVEPDDVPPVQRTVPAPARDPAVSAGVRSAFDLAPKLKCEPPPELEEGAQPPAPAPRPSPAIRVGRAKEVLGQLMAVSVQSPRPPRFALWDDGTLEIRRDGFEPLLLQTADTKRLLDYLDRLREAA